jgi:hypothetical protein
VNEVVVAFEMLVVEDEDEMLLPLFSVVTS